jgi:hypothetical protein
MRGLVAIEGAGNDKNSFVMQGFQEQGRGKDNPVRLEEIGTAMISLEECCWEMQLQQQQNQKGGAPWQQLVVVPIRVRKDGWASDAILYVSKKYHPPLYLRIHPLQLSANCISSGITCGLRILDIIGLCCN